MSAAQIRPLTSSKVQRVKQPRLDLTVSALGKATAGLLYWLVINFIFHLSGAMFRLIESDRAALLLNTVCGLITAVLTILPARVRLVSYEGAGTLPCI